jgi:hypothetical protein
LNELGYPLSVQELDFNILKEQGAIPSGVSPASVKRLCADKYIETAFPSFVNKGFDASTCRDIIGKK